MRLLYNDNNYTKLNHQYKLYKNTTHVPWCPEVGAYFQVYKYI